jgi:hypothetical protein
MPAYAGMTNRKDLQVYLHQEHSEAIFYYIISRLEIVASKLSKGELDV